jgi:hypothetical protein
VPVIHDPSSRLIDVLLPAPLVYATDSGPRAMFDSKINVDRHYVVLPDENQ